MGFAIPINVAKNLLPRLQKAGGGIVAAPQLGVVPGLIAATQRGPVAVGLSALTPQARHAWKLPDSGLLVGTVKPGLPAARAGLRGGNQVQQFRGGGITLGGDVITAAGGRPVDGLEDIQAVLIDRKVGDTVTLRVVNAGKARELKVKLDESSFK